MTIHQLIRLGDCSIVLCSVLFSFLLVDRQLLLVTATTAIRHLQFATSYTVSLPYFYQLCSALFNFLILFN